MQYHFQSLPHYFLVSGLKVSLDLHCPGPVKLSRFKTHLHVNSTNYVNCMLAIASLVSHILIITLCGVEIPYLCYLGSFRWQVQIQWIAS